MDVATLKGSVISALSRVAGGGPEADLVESGSEAHQLYSQITFPWHDASIENVDTFQKVLG